jgi:hypothetical protein
MSRTKSIAGLLIAGVLAAGGISITAPRAQADPTCCGVFLFWCVTDASCPDVGEYWCNVSATGTPCLFNAKDDRKNQNCKEYEHNCSNGGIQ